MTETGHSTGSDRWKTLLAFAIIYFVWGSTFLGIRIGVKEVPPLFFAAMRFFTAGVLLYAWLTIKGERHPSAREWRSIFLVAFVMFVVDYGCLFWAEQRVPSGIAAVILATIPAFMALGEIVLLGTQRMTVRLALALLVGIAGVVVLVSHSLDLGGMPVDRGGAVAILIGATSWSAASILARKLPMPESKMMSAGAQMLSGGAMLFLAAAVFGEFRGLHLAGVSSGVWWSLAYLIVAGSLIGFTAYVWLLHRESPTKVGTYAYVNPVVAVIVGYFFGGEELGTRTIVGTICVLVSVLLITTTKAKTAAAPAVVAKTAES
jgi:drug/metabolite transporter (DMT)-like permease